jgi:hypothetical protein
MQFATKCHEYVHTFVAAMPGGTCFMIKNSVIFCWKSNFGAAQETFSVHFAAKLWSNGATDIRVLPRSLKVPFLHDINWSRNPGLLLPPLLRRSALPVK